MKQFVITDNKSYGNSFGDRAYSVTVEYRIDGKVIEDRLFSDIAHEGEHAHVKRLLSSQIKKWAESLGGQFIGQV